MTLAHAAGSDRRGKRPAARGRRCDHTPGRLL